jgi:hypothetical protein
MNDERMSATWPPGDLIVDIEIPRTWPREHDARPPGPRPEPGPAPDLPGDPDEELPPDEDAR